MLLLRRLLQQMALLLWCRAEGHHDVNDVGRDDQEEDEVDLNVEVNSEALAIVVCIRILRVQLNGESLQSSAM